jgi:hypothetical protein
MWNIAVICRIKKEIEACVLRKASISLNGWMAWGARHNLLHTLLNGTPPATYRNMHLGSVNNQPDALQTEYLK